MQVVYKILSVCVLVTALAVAASGCTTSQEGQKTLTIFHADSLSKPFDEIATAFMKENPNVMVQRESAGSVETVKKVSELNKTADVVATADWIPIQQYLYPNLTSWYGKFASNKMVVMYTNKSKYANEINASNWYQILTTPGVAVGRANPDADPNGYQTILVWKLAQALYNNSTLYDALAQNAPDKYVRQNEVDLTASLQSGEIDYAWNYLSVAKQNNFSYVDLPDQINLSNKTYESLYESVNATSAGTQVNGSLIEYGITVPNNSQNIELANKFIAFVLGPTGSQIMAKNYQPLLKPMAAVGKVPLLLVPFTLAVSTSNATANATTTGPLVNVSAAA
jgi:molybdate/tungstate transport system substrate-binding protein